MTNPLQGSDEETQERKPYVFCERWPAEIRADLVAKRDKAAAFASKLTNRESDYGRAHFLVVDLFDVAIAAVDARLTEIT